MIAGLGAALVAIVLVCAGVLWGLVRLASRAVDAISGTITDHLGKVMGRAMGETVGGVGTVGLGWGITRFAERFSTPILIWTGLLALAAIVVAALTWHVPQTPIGLVVGGALAFLISRGLPRTVENLIRRRLAKGMARRAPH